MILALIGKTDDSLLTTASDIQSVLGPGDRSAAFERIRVWCAESEGQEILISDPYFGPADVDVLFAIAEVCPEKRIRVLTSRRHIRDQVKDKDAEEAFRIAWRDQFDVSPPDAEIVMIGTGDGGHPIHDRWIVGGSSGLRLGTSSNSIGIARLSEISKMDADAAREKCKLINQFLNRSIREWQGSRLQLASFELG